MNLISAAIGIGFIVFALSFTGGGGSDVPAVDAVRIEGGKQVITLRAKGGYRPREVVAKAGVPTVLNMVTEGTFDCSSALLIPALGYRNNLPPSGETVIDIPSQKPGAEIIGTCSMGMYGFTIRFE